MDTPTPTSQPSRQTDEDKLIAWHKGRIEMIQHKASVRKQADKFAKGLEFQGWKDLTKWLSEVEPEIVLKHPKPVSPGGKAQIPKAAKVKKSGPITPSEIQQMRDLRKAGHPYSRIMKITGRSHGSVLSHCGPGAKHTK